MRWHGWLLMGLSVALLGATPAKQVDPLREANDAFERQDYPRAIELYTQAEEEAVDPGAVAFNKATALYRQATVTDDPSQKARMLREAAGYFGRLEDDKGRRARALFGRANCLLLGQSTDANALRDAMRNYRACLNEPAAAELHTDARHNLELAKLLWVKANEKAPAEKPKPDKKEPNSPENKPEEKPKPMNMGTPEPGGNEKPGNKEVKVKVKEQPNGTKPIEVDEEPLAGAGQRPPIPDETQPVQLSADDVANHLERAARKIQEERNNQRRRAAPKLPETVKDW